MTDASHELIQLINPDGHRIEHPIFTPWASEIDTDKLRDMYSDLLVSRRIDAEATALQRQGELGLWAPMLGQEAAQVGSARALRPDDFIFSSYREHAVAYCRGVDPTQMLRFWRGSTHSGWNPLEYRMTTPAIIVGAQGLHATGYAMGISLDGADSAAIAYFGDGATSQGDISEAFGFASSFSAPVVFFCQNNQWAISEPVALQSRRSIAERGEGFGIESVRVDGNDVLAVYAVTSYALHRAREGSGPTLIEAVTYRMGPHTTSDDPTRYRSAADDAEWKAKDPVDRVRALLEREGAIDEALQSQIQAEADRVAAALRKGCLETVEPLPMTLFEDIYAEPHSLITEERDRYASYLDALEKQS